MSLPENDTSKLGCRESNLQRQDKQTNGCRLLTGPGRSAIAVIEVRGPDATDVVDQLFVPATRLPWKVGVIRYGRWAGSTDRPKPNAPASAPPKKTAPEASESVVVVLTEPHRHEIHCHGGPAAVERILEDLMQAGFPQSEHDSHDCHWTGEAREILSRCTTTRTAGIVLDQMRSGVSAWRLKALRELEHDRDSAKKLAAQAEEIVKSGAIGLHLDRPWDVVLAGPPNVGKSSLINALVGYDRSITMDVAGTTRDVLDAETVINGWPIRFRDTAGLHLATEQIEQQGIARAVDAIREADLIIRVSEPGTPPDQSRFNRALTENGRDKATINVINKADLTKEETDKPRADRPPYTLRTVATSGQGIGTLQDAILRSLGLQSPQKGRPIAITERQVKWATRIAESMDDSNAMLKSLRSEP